jgi:hypothetical protein
MSGYCFSYLFGGRGTLGAGMERPVGGSDEIHGRRSYIGRTGVQMSSSIAILSARIQKRSRSEGMAGHNNFPIQNLEFLDIPKFCPKRGAESIPRD